MHNKDISIIVPVFNVELYLEDCLQSVLRQDFQNYEIICVNDASTDDSAYILKKYASANPEIKVINHSENRGLSEARNTGLKYAQGKYIMFLDSDDMIAPNSLTELFFIAEKNQVDIAYFNLRYENEEDYRNAPSSDVENYEYNEVCSGRELFCLFMENHCTKISVWLQFIKRKFLEEYKIEFYKGILHEDALFSFLCAMNAQKVINVNKDYYIYRRRLGSITNTRDYRRAGSVFVVLVQIMAFWTSHDFTDREHQAIAQYFEMEYNSYQYYLTFDKSRTELEIGGPAERTLYSLIHNKEKKRYLILNEDAMRRITMAGRVIVFGAGRAAVDIVKALKERNVKIDAIAVSNRETNPEKFLGIKVDSIDNIAHCMKDAVIVIGVTKKYSKGILEKLEQLGYSNIITAEEVNH